MNAAFLCTSSILIFIPIMFQSIVVPTVTCSQPKRAGFAKESIEFVSQLPGLAYIKNEAEVNMKLLLYAPVS